MAKRDVILLTRSPYITVMLQNIPKQTEKCTKSFIFDSSWVELLVSCRYTASYEITETPTTTTTKRFDPSFIIILNKIKWPLWHQKYWKDFGTIERIPWNDARKFWRSSPRWWEVSDPFQTNSIDRLCIQPYHITMRKSWLFLSWLVGQFEFENSCFVFCFLRESNPVLVTQWIICLLLCVLFNYINSR